MTIFVTVLHVLVCLILIGLVLLQKGKGAEIGAVFGGSSASTIFGSAGAGNFLTKLTTWAAVVFMITSFYLAYVALNAEAGGKFAAPPPGIETPAASPAAAEAPTGDFVEVKEVAPAAPVEPAAAATTEPAAAPSAPAPAAPPPGDSPQ